MKTKAKRFNEYLEEMSLLWPGVSHSPGTPAFIQCMRIWNTMAMLFPEQVEDAVYWEESENPNVKVPPRLIDNPYRKIDTMKDFETPQERQARRQREAQAAEDAKRAQIIGDRQEKEATAAGRAQQDAAPPAAPPNIPEGMTEEEAREAGLLGEAEESIGAPAGGGESGEGASESSEASQTQPAGAAEGESDSTPDEGGQAQEGAPDASEGEPEEGQKQGGQKKKAGKRRAGPKATAAK